MINESITSKIRRMAIDRIEKLQADKDFLQEQLTKIIEVKRSLMRGIESIDHQIETERRNAPLNQ